MKFPVEQFQGVRTPFYYYDRKLLEQTLDVINREAARYAGFHVHYAVKANVDPTVLSIVNAAGLGCDCVSGGEVEVCLKAGFPASKVVFAGVGKADWEINLALDADIACFNVESAPELDVINELAQAKGKVARVALRVNPNVDAHTHHYITTGLSENKFGISMDMLDMIVQHAHSLPNISFEGLHFHIGSQILDLQPFVDLCNMSIPMSIRYRISPPTSRSLPSIWCCIETRRCISNWDAAWFANAGHSSVVCSM